MPGVNPSLLDHEKLLGREWREEGGEFPGNELHKTSNNQYSLTNEYQLNISAPNKAYEGI